MANITRTIIPNVSMDSDSAFSCDDDSSYGSLPEGSFGLTDSALDAVSNVTRNPFESFRHQGPLPHSVFDDSSSFASSPMSQRTSSKCSLENSTHIYINVLDQTSILQDATDHCKDSGLGPRTAGDGKEDSNHQCQGITDHLLAYGLPTPKRRNIAKNLKKIGKFLHGKTTHNFEVETLAVL